VRVEAKRAASSRTTRAPKRAGPPGRALDSAMGLEAPSTGGMGGRAARGLPDPASCSAVRASPRATAAAATAAPHTCATIPLAPPTARPAGRMASVAVRPARQAPALLSAAAAVPAVARAKVMAGAPAAAVAARRSAIRAASMAIAVRAYAPLAGANRRRSAVSPTMPARRTATVARERAPRPRGSRSARAPRPRPPALPIAGCPTESSAEAMGPTAASSTRPEASRRVEGLVAAAPAPHGARPACSSASRQAVAIPSAISARRTATAAGPRVFRGVRASL
jgi:hypothetical protein